MGGDGPKAVGCGTNVLAAIALCIIVGIAACNEDGRGPAPPPPNGVPWVITWSPNVPETMTAMPDGSYAVDIPQVDGLHYITRAANGAHPTLLRMRFRVEGDGIAIPTQGDPPARVRLYVQRAGDDWTLARGASYRFWSAPADLVAGEFTLEAPLAAESWTNVNGQNDGAGLAALLGELANIGFTFGGQFAGHGVTASGGNVRFVLLQYDVQ